MNDTLRSGLNAVPETRVRVAAELHLMAEASGAYGCFADIDQERLVRGGGFAGGESVMPA